MAKAASKSAPAAKRERPQAVMFDGKTLPAGADEDWWGAPDGSDSELRTINVPFRANNQALGGFSTRTARAGDMVTVWPAEGTEGEADYRRAFGLVGEGDVGLPPDDEALSGIDKQTEYMHDAHKRAHGLAAEKDPGATIYGAVSAPGAAAKAETENAAADTPENRRAARERAEREERSR